MRLSLITCLAIAAISAPTLSAQTYFSLHAGTDGIGVDVSNVSPYFPVVVVPPAPRPHVHVPLMPGYVPDYDYGRSYRKAVRKHRDVRHHRSGVVPVVYAVPYGGFFYDDDDVEDFYEDYYKHARKHMKKYSKRQKKEWEHRMKHHKKHHKHHHHDD